MNIHIFFFFKFVYSECGVVPCCSVAVTCVETDMRPEGVGADGEM